MEIGREQLELHVGQSPECWQHVDGSYLLLSLVEDRAVT